MPVLGKTTKKFLAICFGLTLGASLAGGLWCVRRVFSPPPRQITQADQAKLREVLDKNPKAIYLFDETVSYRLKPNFHGVRFFSDTLPHITNSLGLLGPEEISTDPRVRKLIFLGDSVTYGNGVGIEQNFVSRMQAAAGSNFQLLNGACPGWSTHQELGYYQKYLSDTPCELLAVVFCVNDLAKYEWVYGTDDKPQLSGEVPQWSESSALTLKLSLLRKDFAANPQTAPLAKHHNGFVLAWDRDSWERYVNEMLRPFFIKRDSPPIVFIALPSAFQVEAARLGADTEKVFFPQTQLQNACRELGAYYIDAAESLAAAPSDQPVFMDDCHLTVAGHERVSQFLWPHLASLLSRDSTARSR